MCSGSLTWINKNHKTILWLAILLYIVTFSSVCLWKYSIFAYDGLDLAIFNNVFWQTAHGQLFALSIHPHSFLGDHAGFGLMFLLPFYVVFPDPRTLLVLQTITLACTAWPIYLLARAYQKKFLSNEDKKNENATPLVIALAWLLNPLVHNINLFEFHLLPFALVPLFFMILAYENNRRGHFIFFALLAMLFREDVPLVVAAIGLLATLEKKSWWWRLTPIALGGAWFLMATRVIAHFAPNSSYKFSIYYSWIFEKPNDLLSHLFTLGNLEMLLGFGLPLLFLPYLAPKKLILLLGPLLQILLSAPGGSSVVLQTHYSVLFLPGLFAATITSVKKIDQQVIRKSAMSAILLLAAFYGALTLGPLPAAAEKITSKNNQVDTRAAKEMIKNIPADMPVVASYRLLPHLSSRKQIFSAHYVFLGIEQFGTGPYTLPPNESMYLVFDDRDLMTYRAQFLQIGWAQPHYDGGRERLAAIANNVLLRRGHFTIYDSKQSTSFAPPSLGEESTKSIGLYRFADDTIVHAARSSFQNDRLSVTLDLTLGSEPLADKILIFVPKQKKSDPAVEIFFPLINDLQQVATPGARYIHSVELPASQITDNTKIEVELRAIKSKLVLDDLNSTALDVITEITLGSFQLD
jgi:uncharacterized membrane protein